MSTTSENNKRIAKNSLMLYLRMVLMMIVTLYTSRVIFRVLGVTDFGLYNVVGGVVSMLGFISGSMGSATSRFITFEIGKKTLGNVKHVFRCAVTVHYIIAFILFLVAETIGLWFVTTKMIIPEERMFAALCVYQCSIVTFVISIISVPYNALIIAHERMSAFAYISIYEAFSKLIVVLLLEYSDSDRLIFYAVSVLLIQITIRLIYTLYCNKHFQESSAKLMWDKKISRKLVVYAGWTINGGLATVGYTQGINILLNLFFGPAVNAARGIAIQVQGAVYQFLSSFLMAVRPQITKSYAQNDFDYMHLLMINSSRYAFYLMSLLAFPLLVHTDFVLNLWLGDVPEHTVNFTRIMIVVCIHQVLREPTLMAIHATGDLRKFQLCEGTLLLSIVPIAYVCLKFFHVSSEMVFIIYLIIEIITQNVRVIIVYPKVKLHIYRYFIDILLPIIKVGISLCIVIFPFKKFFTINTFFDFTLNCILIIVISIVIIFIVGLSSAERNYIFNKIKSIKK